MTVAAFVLSVLGFGIAVASLTWQVYTFLMQGARPALTPVVGLLTVGGGLVTNDATRDVRASLMSAAAQLPPGQLIVGVKVVNAGRAPFHVAKWALRADPSGAVFQVMGEQVGSPSVPCDIPPGAEQIFFMYLDGAVNLRRSLESVEGAPQRIVATVSSGGRTYASKPIAAELLSIE
uniref:hypothetical protein n=1 Tax=Rhodococcus sp. NS1 TaxID=402236 RepID=UPI001564DD43|nr:hypothetical protein [Rhodococcus sp. NS1]